MKKKLCKGFVPTKNRQLYRGKRQSDDKRYDGDGRSIDVTKCHLCSPKLTTKVLSLLLSWSKVNDDFQGMSTLLAARFCNTAVVDLTQDKYIR